MVAVGRIAPSPYQPRKHFDPDRLQELTRAIESQGVIEPLVVRPLANGDAESPMYELPIAGERRLRAAKRGPYGGAGGRCAKSNSVPRLRFRWWKTWRAKS